MQRCKKAKIEITFVDKLKIGKWKNREKQELQEVLKFPIEIF